MRAVNSERRAAAGSAVVYRVSGTRVRLRPEVHRYLSEPSHFCAVSLCREVSAGVPALYSLLTPRYFGCGFASLRDGAGGGNRTLAASLEGWRSTTELRPRGPVKAREGQRRLPGASSPLRRAAYCELMPPVPPFALVERAASLAVVALARPVSRRTSPNSRASSASTIATMRLSRESRSCVSAFFRAR